MTTQTTRSVACALLQPSPMSALLKRHRVIAQLRSEPADEAGIQSGPYGIVPRITHLDRVIIRRYFKECGNNSGILNHSEYKQSKPWTRNQSLPAELRTTLLPSELEEKLSALAIGYERVKVGDDVLLVDAATRTIIDVLPDL